MSFGTADTISGHVQFRNTDTIVKGSERQSLGNAKEAVRP